MNLQLVDLVTAGLLSSPTARDCL